MAEVEQAVAGNSLHSFRVAVGQIWGEDVVARGLASLDDDTRLSVEQAAALLWIPMPVLTRAVDAWAAAASISGDELTERGVRVSTKLSFHTVLRAFLHFTTDDALLTRAPLLYTRVRRGGKLTGQRLSERHGRFVLSEWRGGTDRQLLSLVVSFETVLEITGRTDARCRFRRTSDGGVIEVKWGDPSAPALRWDSRQLR